MRKNKKVIFIGGSSYSGSTMLDMMMANSTQGFSVGEVHALFRPFRPHHFAPSCGCGDPQCTFWNKVRHGGAKNLYETILKLLPEIKYIVDSSKDPFWIRNQTEILTKSGIESHLLLIWKEPAAFAHSMRKRGREGWMKAWINYHLLFFSLFDNFIPIPYHDLAKDPSGTLQKICDQTGIDFQAGMEEFWRKQHHTLFGNRTAKTHLAEYDNDSSGRHRSIYFENDYTTSLTESDWQMIEGNTTINNIIQTLEGRATARRSNGTKLSPGQTATTKLRHSIKALIGGMIGRYVRLF